MEKSIFQQMQGNIGNLTKAQLQVYEYIQQHPVEASFQTLDQIAANIGTSTTTVMRFAFNIGFSGYSELQKELQNFIRNKLTPETRMTKNLENINDISLIAKCAEKQIDNINKTQAMLTEELLQESVRLIKESRKIFLLGARTSFTVSYYLYQCLNQQLSNCEILSYSIGQEVDQILDITADDLMIVISLPRYARSSIEIVKAVRLVRNPKVLLISDGYTAPLAPYSDVILPCEYDSLSFHNSMAAPLYIAELLVAELSKLSKEDTAKRLSDAEKIMQALNYHFE